MYFVATRHLHDLAWWIILFTGLWAVFRAWRGRLARLPWTRKERLAGLVFSSALATQLLIGLALYFQSPLVHALFAGGAAGLDPQAAIFFGLLHPLIMFTAVVLGQVGFSVSKRLSDDRRKYVIATGCYTAALAVVLLAVLWAWFSYGRPLLPYHAHTRGWDLQPPQPAAVPVAVNKRLAGIYPVGSWIPDRSALGGFGPCDNYPFDLGEAAWGTRGAISLVAFPYEPVAYFKFRGIAVRLINCSGELASFPACDSCLQMVQEAQGGGRPLASDRIMARFGLRQQLSPSIPWARPILAISRSALQRPSQDEAPLSAGLRSRAAPLFQRVRGSGQRRSIRGSRGQ